MKRSLAFFIPGFFLLACGSSGNDTGDGLLKAPDPGKGVQYQMVYDLESGVETERCRFFVVGDGGLYVHGQDVRFTSGSHHVLLFTTSYAEVPKKDRYGVDVDTSAVFDCGARGPTAHWDITGVAGGSQIANGKPIVDGTALPADTAVVIPGGTVLLMNTHYLNASGTTLHTDARINLHTIPKEQVKQQAGFVFFYNPFIALSPMSRGAAREVCPVTQDITLLNAQSHMHKRGVNYKAVLTDDKGTVQGESLYEGTDWAEVRMKSYSPGRQLKAGQFVDFQCEYDNKENRTVRQGLATTDEMCMFIGLYYPQNRKFELCGLDDKWDNAFLGGRWIGNGTKTGAETLGCISSGGGDGGFYGCVVNSCPQITNQVSNAARCLLSNGGGACNVECGRPVDNLSQARPDPMKCSACRNASCVQHLGALMAAKCE